MGKRLRPNVFPKKTLQKNNQNEFCKVGCLHLEILLKDRAKKGKINFFFFIYFSDTIF